MDLLQQAVEEQLAAIGKRVFLIIKYLRAWVPVISLTKGLQLDTRMRRNGCGLL